MNALRFRSMLAVVVLTACSRDHAVPATQAANVHTARAVVSAQGAGVPQAEARLAKFLDGALETHSRFGFDSLMTCDPDGQTDRYVTLARYDVLGSTLRGDTVDAYARIVTVAEEAGDPHMVNRYVTRVRVRTDTLHWLMTRNKSGQSWGVCGYSKEGIGFGHYGNDQNTQWDPPGFSWVRVKHLADSMNHSG